MKNNFTKSKIDQLGQKIKLENLTEDNLKLLDEYRKSFGDSYKYVINIIRKKLKLKPTGRPAKSTGSIIDKLHRESIRLSQMQDIAGCRIVISGINEQDRIIDLLLELFPGSRIIDRRDIPSHGYRAVHIIPIIFNRPIEIQIRTKLQNYWSIISERYSDLVDLSVKYGKGPKYIHDKLNKITDIIIKYEILEKKYLNKKISRLEKKEVKRKMKAIYNEFFIELKNIISDWRILRGGNDFFNTI